MALGVTFALTGCSGPVAEFRAEPVATFLTDDLLRISVEVAPEIGQRALRELTDCAAADAVLLKGSAFARHVRTTLSEEAGISRADAVYTVSPTLPAGRFTMDAETTAAACRERELEGV